MENSNTSRLFLSAFSCLLRVVSCRGHGRSGCVIGQPAAHTGERGEPAISVATANTMDGAGLHACGQHGISQYHDSELLTRDWDEGMGAPAGSHGFLSVELDPRFSPLPVREQMGLGSLSAAASPRTRRIREQSQFLQNVSAAVDRRFQQLTGAGGRYGLGSR